MSGWLIFLIGAVVGGLAAFGGCVLALWRYSRRLDRAEVQPNG